jgi:hypothetical protein
MVNNENSQYMSTYKNELHPCHSFRIFAVTNMQRSKVDKTIIEMLVGHSIGLDTAYFKPQDDEILSEFKKATDNLTINNEHRLKKQIQEFEDKNKDSEYFIKGKLQEKDEQIKSLADQFSSMKDILNQLVKGLSETKDQQQVNGVTQSLFSLGAIKEVMEP